MAKSVPKFDCKFEKKRLDQLQHQCLKGKDIYGHVVFACMTDDTGGVSGMTGVWSFLDDDLLVLREAKYFYYCWELLEVFANYRSQFDGLESNGGILLFRGSNTSIIWLPEHDAMVEIEPQRDSIKKRYSLILAKA